mgnify:CR=1 FL=1
MKAQPVCRECGAEVSRKSTRCHPCYAKSIVQHGQTKTRLFRIYTGMMARCGHYKGATAHDRRRYIERGIEVCAAWRDFAAFHSWATANGYADDLSIDRIDNDKGYGPDNCRWVSQAENSRNRRIAKLTHDAVASIKDRIREGLSQRAIAREFSVSPSMISFIKSGRTWAGVGGAL